MQVFMYGLCHVNHNFECIAILNSMRALQNLDLASVFSSKNHTLGSYDKIMHIGIPIRN